MDDVLTLRAEAQHLRTLAQNITNPDELSAIMELIHELERRIRNLENGET